MPRLNMCAEVHPHPVEALAGTNHRVAGLLRRRRRQAPWRDSGQLCCRVSVAVGGCSGDGLAVKLLHGCLMNKQRSRRLLSEDPLTTLRDWVA